MDAQNKNSNSTCLTRRQAYHNLSRVHSLNLYVSKRGGAVDASVLELKIPGQSDWGRGIDNEMCRMTNTEMNTGCSRSRGTEDFIEYEM